MKDPRGAAFDALLASCQLVPLVLEADKDAVSGKEMYDDDYFERFLATVRPVLEERLGGAITATASLLWGAWDPKSEGRSTSTHRKGSSAATAVTLLGCEARSVEEEGHLCACTNQHGDHRTQHP